MDDINLSVINNQTLVDIIQELYPVLNKRIRSYSDLQTFSLSKENKEWNDNILIFDVNEKSLSKDLLPKIKVPAICLTSNLNDNHNFYNLKIEKILKPFKINAFLLKIKICQSKNKFEEMSFIKILDYHLDINRREIAKNKKKLKLTEREVNFLIYLNTIQKPATINEILSSVWKYSDMTETHTVETHVHRLRKKFLQTFGDKNTIKNNSRGYYI